MTTAADGQIVLRKTVGSWSAGTRVLVRHREGPSLVVVPVADRNGARPEVLVVDEADVTQLRPRSTTGGAQQDGVTAATESRLRVARQLASLWQFATAADASTLGRLSRNLDRLVPEVPRS